MKRIVFFFRIGFSHRFQGYAQIQASGFGAGVNYTEVWR